MGIFPIGLLALFLMIFFLLDRHEKRREKAGQPRHSGPRLLIASLAMLTILFSGGCASLFFATMSGSQGQYIDWPVILIFAGPPFVIGVIVWWLAMRRPAG
jgi:hypothetical protein